MDFNKDLFLKLCKDYDVEMKSKSGKCQIIINDVPQDLTEEIVRNLLVEC